jgi:hypothetical protein
MIRLPHLVAAGALVLALGINVIAWAVQARAQTQNRAGLVVQMADGSVVTRCVSFSEESLSGYELLRRAKLPLVVEVSGMGPAVCKIGDSGCNYPQQSCFCQCNTLDASCTYWAYAQFKDGAWRASPIGAAGSKVRNGDVDGWRWGKGDGTTGENPPVISLDEICSAASQPATTQPAATAVQPTSTNPAPAEGPTETALPSPTAAPSTTPAPATTATAKPTQAPSPTQNAPTATALPQPTPTPLAQPDATTTNSPLPLLGFGAIAAVLVIGFALVRRRGDA